MDWYRVTKRIRGRSYDYWQKTYRVGRSVKTLNKYIGPHGSGRVVYPPPNSTPDYDRTNAALNPYRNVNTPEAKAKWNEITSAYYARNEKREKERIAAIKQQMKAPEIEDPNDVRHIVHGADKLTSLPPGEIGPYVEDEDTTDWDWPTTSKED